MSRTKSVNIEKNNNEVEDSAKEKIEVDEEKEKMLDIIKELKDQVESLKKEVDNNKESKKTNEYYTKNYATNKIKCINLMHNMLNVSTEPDGQGRLYSFDEYGSYRMIPFDQLADIVSSYPYTMEHGLLYICDKNVVDMLGLTDEYKNIYTKDVIDKMIYLKRQSDVDIFIGMEDNLRKSTAIEIAKLYNANEKFDYNMLREIKDKTGIDIEQIAKDLKEESTPMSEANKEDR
jgi:hypothetical protein